MADQWNMTGTTGEMRFICATAGGRAVAFPIADVQEVFSARIVTRLFHAPRPVLGVVSLRGDILPVVDLGRLLGAEPGFRGGATGAIDEEARVVVLRVPLGAHAAAASGGARSAPLGVLVTALAAMRTVTEGAFSALPAGVPEPAARLASGVLSTPLPAALVIDAAKIVSNTELASLRAA